MDTSTQIYPLHKIKRLYFERTSESIKLTKKANKNKYFFIKIRKIVNKNVQKTYIPEKKRKAMIC